MKKQFMNQKILGTVLFVFAMMVSSFAQKQAPQILPTQWQSTYYSQNPLVGQIFKGTGQKSQIDVLVAQAQLTRFVLLGEQHDNPDHHLIQANILKAFTASGRKPSVVFEMVPQSLERELQSFNLTSDPNLEDFAKRLKWEERGWYSWEVYRPIAIAAIKANMPMFAGNLDVEKTRVISKKGMAALTASEIENLNLNSPMPKVAETILLSDLANAHCGMMPKTALPGMFTVQRARDGAMAHAMAKTSDTFGSVLIGGNGHVRKDIGVPLVLRSRLTGTRDMKLGKAQDGRDIVVRVPNAHTLSIGLVEVQQGKESFDDYSLANANGDALYDYVIFTPKFDITDHCALMREQFQKMKKKTNSE